MILNLKGIGKVFSLPVHQAITPDYPIPKIQNYTFPVQFALSQFMKRMKAKNRTINTKSRMTSLVSGFIESTCKRFHV
jgi:hypothetical protein